MPIHVRFALDGSGVWVMEQGASGLLETIPFVLRRLDWDGEEVERIEGLGHTSFALLGGGRVAVLRKVVEDYGCTEVLIDNVMIFEDGVDRGSVWKVTDDLDLDDWPRPAEAVQPRQDWFHVNWIAPSSRPNTVLLSLGDA